MDLWVNGMFCVGKQTVNAMYGQQSNAAISRCHINTFASIIADKFHTIATLVADNIICYVLRSDIVVAFCPTASVQIITDCCTNNSNCVL